MLLLLLQLQKHATAATAAPKRATAASARLMRATAAEANSCQSARQLSKHDSCQTTAAKARDSCQSTSQRMNRGVENVPRPPLGKYAKTAHASYSGLTHSPPHETAQLTLFPALSSHFGICLPLGCPCESDCRSNTPTWPAFFTEASTFTYTSYLCSLGQQPFFPILIAADSVQKGSQKRSRFDRPLPQFACGL